MESPVGKEYQITRGSLQKAVLAKILKTIFLWKNGLNRCRQIIVGGEQADSELLYHYREIGIELYQAYGQPEIPMIALNRLGDNMIPSIGTVLPETQVVADEKKELIVTGPQVSAGYYEEKDDRLLDGSFHTGIRGGSGKNHHLFIIGYMGEEPVEETEEIEEQAAEQEISDEVIITEQRASVPGEKTPWKLEPLNVDMIKKGLRTIEHMKIKVQPPEEKESTDISDSIPISGEKESFQEL